MRIRTMVQIGGAMIGGAWSSYGIASQVWRANLPYFEKEEWVWLSIGIGWLLYSAFIAWGWYSTHSELQEYKNTDYKKHCDFLLEFLKGIGSFDIAKYNERHLVICWANPKENECSIPKGKAYWTEDTVNISLYEESKPEWNCLIQHLNKSSFTEIFRGWKMAMSQDLIARHILFDTITKNIESAVNIPIIFVPSESQEGEPHITLSYVERLYHQVLSQKIGIRTNQLTERDFQNTEKDKMRLGGEVIVYSNDITKRGKVLEFFVQSQASMLELAEAVEAENRYGKAQKETNKLNNEMRKIIIAGSFPPKSRCDTCPI